MGWKWKTVLLPLVLMQCYLKCKAYQNSNISYTMTNNMISLTCKYTGNETVDAVSWLNGSSDIPLTMQVDSSSVISNKSSFETSRIQDSRCNSSTKICILIISRVRSTETFACMFLDPDPGKPKAVVTIPEKDVPDVPYNVTITDVKQTSLTVQYAAGCNGGLEQTLHIMITDGNISRNMYVPDPGYGKYGTQTIEDLMPNTKYGIQMSANNSMGSSNLTNVIFQNTLKGNLTDGVGGGGGLSLSAIVGITAGVFIFLMLAAAAIIYVCRKCKANTVSGKKKVSEPIYSYRVVKGKADQESSKPDSEEYEDLHKGEK